MTLQEQLDNFPSGYEPVIIEAVDANSVIVPIVITALVLDHTWDDTMRARLVPMPLRYVHHSKNWIGLYHNPQGFPSNGDGLYSLVRVYKLYDVASYMGKSLTEIGAE